MTFKIPHVFIFLSVIILFCALLTYIVPSGSFERTTRKFGEIEQSVVVPRNYKELPKHFSVKGIFFNEEVEGKASPISLTGLLTAIPKGMQQSAALICSFKISWLNFSALDRRLLTLSFEQYRTLFNFQKTET